MTDQELARRILTRDRQALAEFYRLYKPKLESYIRVRIGDARDAEEVLQDTLFAFLEALRDFHGAAKLQTFLFSICNHKIIDFYRRRKVRHLVFSRAPYLEGLMTPLFTSQEEQVDAAFLREKIQRVFGRLLPRYREILAFKYIENLPVDRIASKLAISFKSAESRLFRARKAFIETFESL